jgi:hypothetical protein
MGPAQQFVPTGALDEEQGSSDGEDEEYEGDYNSEQEADNIETDNDHIIQEILG